VQAEEVPLLAAHARRVCAMLSSRAHSKTTMVRAESRWGTHNI
jgi:hypothetical protein